MRIWGIGLACCALLGACGRNAQPAQTGAPTAAADTAATANYLTQATGVWSGADGGLITIDYRGGKLRLVIDDQPKFVRLGDVDLANGTINLLLKRTSDGQDIIWTLHRVADSGGAGFHQELILDDGRREALSFVRAITADDINRLANLYARPTRSADLGAVAPQVSGASSPTAATAATAPPAAGSEVSVVRAFYGALSAGDGDAASRLVIPEKRQSGPFSAQALSRFYGHMSQPLRLTAAQDAGAGQFVVRYTYTLANGRVCDGSAIVRTVEVGGHPLVQSISAGGC